MEPSQTCFDLIKSFEGCRLIAYEPPESTPEKPVWAIGYGHTSLTVRQGDSCTQAQADAYLIADARSCAGHIVGRISSPHSSLSQNQFDALVSFAYNVGVGMFGRSTLLKKINAGDLEGAAAEFLRWNRAAGRALEGLTRRREAERTLFMAG